MPVPYYSGIIVTYNCTAACRHCMFASCPHVAEDARKLYATDTENNYITYEKTLEICRKLASAGTTSMHIGGGEPFINFDGLCSAVNAMTECGIGVDYIETNCFWCKDTELVKRRAMHLKSMGVDTIMASLDPFHIEYVPLQNVVNFCNVMNQIGMDYFVWQDKFYSRLLPLDMTTTHTVSELKALLGEDYAGQTAREYGLGMNGRALKLAEKMYPLRTVDSLTAEDNPCTSLASGRHCHVDLYGRVTPSGCPGISVDLDDYLAVSHGFDPEKYPLVSALDRKGVAGAVEYAEKMGVNVKDKLYPSKCSLCYHIRKSLSHDNGIAEIAPKEFYVGMEDK